MEFFKITKRFKKDEDGAVTVDWVVLTAAIVGLGVAVIASVRTATESLGDRISEEIENQMVGTTTTTP
jgi:Flp pilus assembly pilin Flp